MNLQENIQRIKQMMGLIIENKTSSDICDFNVTKTPNINSTDADLPKEQIENDIKNDIQKSIQFYKNWYSKPDTLKKINNNDIVAKMLKYIEKIPYYCYWEPIKNDDLHNMKIAWVYTGEKNPNFDPDKEISKTIFINVFNIYKDGKYHLDLYNTLHHEIGHLIDGFFVNYDVQVYKKTHDKFAITDIMKNYIINDKDQFTRLNVLRGLIGAEPLDSPKEMLNKFVSSLNDKTITLTGYTVSKKVTSYKDYKKNDSTTSWAIFEKIKNSFFVDNKLEINIPQLLSTFSELVGNEIHVNFNLISEFNTTTAKSNTSGDDKELLMTSLLGEEKKSIYWLVLKPSK